MMKKRKKRTGEYDIFRNASILSSYVSTVRVLTALQKQRADIRGKIASLQEKNKTDSIEYSLYVGTLEALDVQVRSLRMNLAEFEDLITIGRSKEDKKNFMQSVNVLADTTDIDAEDIVNTFLKAHTMTSIFSSFLR